MVQCWHPVKQQAAIPSTSSTPSTAQHKVRRTNGGASGCHHLAMRTTPLPVVNTDAPHGSTDIMAWGHIHTPLKTADVQLRWCLACCTHKKVHPHTGTHHPPAPGEDTCHSPRRAGCCLLGGARPAWPPTPCSCTEQGWPVLLPASCAPPLDCRAAAGPQLGGHHPWQQGADICVATIAHRLPPPGGRGQAACCTGHSRPPCSPLRPSHTKKHTHILGISEVENGHPQGNRAALPLKQGRQQVPRSQPSHIRLAAVAASQAPPSRAAA